MLSNSSHNNDKELWEAIKHGSQQAFSDLYKRHVHSLYQFGLSISSDKEMVKDCIQELFVDFWKKRLTLSEVSQVKVYLIKSLRFNCFVPFPNPKNTVRSASKIWLYDIPGIELAEQESDAQRKQRLKAMLLQITRQTAESHSP